MTLTHPFHPQRGQQIHLVTRRQNWGEDRIMYYNEQENLVSILASWTDVDPPDFFTQASAGRSWFRIDDLQRMRGLVDDLMVGECQ